MSGCTNCSSKGGCTDRKGEMFAVRDETLARLYPTRRWGERDDDAAFGAGIGEPATRKLAAALAQELKAATFYVAGDEHEYCDYIYILCLGRQPSLLELRRGEALADIVATPQWGDAPHHSAQESALQAELAMELRQEVYLRVCVSTVAPLAAVQQVAMSLETAATNGTASVVEGAAADTTLLIREAPRDGVYDGPLLARMQKLVAILPEHGLTHLDFGEISEPPADFDPGDYVTLYGRAPDIANFLFFPQPSTTQSVFSPTS